ncbi:Cytochrome c5 [Modicisalibacter muralis]|uniref:Cytochrome c5 n=1 Tax=Modicisalibacter muralis TaxID=119000 RepID=A0A1G9KLM6_9GAMM|nr:c-type cytochrome [Halomonas muralis]SDL50700.1 Cytochrome c5 [Halomonas muralis]
MKFKKWIMGALATLGLAVGTASAQSSDMSNEAIAKRLAPVGELCLVDEDCGGAAPAAAAGGGGGGKSGEEIYASVCMACHDTGAAGAPKRGDAAAWGSRMEKGMETLYAHAIDGFNAMPAKGGNPSLSDQDVKSAVNYLTEPVRGDDVAIDTGSDAGAAAAEDATADAEAAPAEGATTEVAAAGGSIDGAAIYAQVCTACHATGVAGAPKRGDAAAWSPRLEKGVETLYSSAINGLGVMPPKGGNPNLSDAEVKAAVDHLIAPVQ